MMTYNYGALGDCGITIDIDHPKITVETIKQIQKIKKIVEEQNPPWLIECVPAMTSLTVFYQPALARSSETDHLSPYSIVCAEIQKWLNEDKKNISIPSQLIELPVCYEDDCSLDMDTVSTYTQLSKKEIIKLHSTTIYHVHMIGFAPGFPYLGGLDERLFVPRQANPRLLVPSGSVGIGGRQTGIYPHESPGGWNIIGRTPISLFNLKNNPPSILKSGDRVKFIPISFKEYSNLRHK